LKLSASSQFMTLSFRSQSVLAIVLSCACAHAPLVAADAKVDELIQAAKSGAEASRVKALDQLAAMGEKAADAVPSVTQLLNDASANVRAHAAHALGGIGSAAKPSASALTNLVQDSDETVRRQAVQALAAIRPGADIMVPLVTRLLEDSDPAVKARILQAVSEAGPAAIPSLKKALTDDKAAYWACLILREMGAEAKDAIPELTATLKNSRPEVRREAALALGAMRDAASSAVGEIAPLVSDEHAAEAATLALGQIGKIPAGAEEKIRANAKSDKKLLSTVSLWTLARVHPEDKALARETAEQLVARLADKDPFVRVTAARGLAALRLGPDIMVPIMEKALANADETTAYHALDAVAALGPASVPRLVEYLKYPKLRAQVAYSLGQIGPPAAPATGDLAKLLSSNDSRTVTEAAVALAKIGPTAASSVPSLTAALKQTECPNPHAIAYALGKMGPAAAAAQPDLINLLGSKDQSVAVVAAWALTRVDPQSSETSSKVVPALIAGLGDLRAESRQMAAETLGGLKSAAKPAIPALEKAATDENRAVRDAASEALRAIR
jgi:HEAT repeat protein